MKLDDIRLVSIDLYDGDNLVYTGKIEETPEEYKNRHVEFKEFKDKKMVLKLI